MYCIWTNFLFFVSKYGPGYLLPTCTHKCPPVLRFNQNTQLSTNVFKCCMHHRVYLATTRLYGYYWLLKCNSRGIFGISSAITYWTKPIAKMIAKYELKTQPFEMMENSNNASHQAGDQVRQVTTGLLRTSKAPISLPPKTKATSWAINPPQSPSKTTTTTATSRQLTLTTLTTITTTSQCSPPLPIYKERLDHRVFHQEVKLFNLSISEFFKGLQLWWDE